ARKELLPDEPTLEDLDRSRALLEAWEKDAPQKPKQAPRLMRICYWTPQDREPQPEHRARLTRVMTHIQAFYLREMASWGLPRQNHPARSRGGQSPQAAPCARYVEIRRMQRGRPQ
ncbi:MAG TPA: hypothetical protein VGE39_21580, partial [Prosthecobacter sp.]